MSEIRTILLKLTMAALLVLGFFLPSNALAQDPYEPDDDPHLARVWNPSLEGAPRRNFHDVQDRDWIKVYLLRNELFDILGDELGPVADVEMQIFFKHPDGQLEPVSPLINQQEQGSLFPEQFSMPMGEQYEGFPQGFYYIRFTPGTASAVGPDSDYEFKVDNYTIQEGQSFGDPGRKATAREGRGGTREPDPPPAGPGYFICVAVDRVETNRIPLDAKCRIEGVANDTFTNQNMYYALTPGVYTVTVTAADGYEYVEDPLEPNQVLNNTNEFYGAPKERVIVESGWNIGVFLVTPYSRTLGQVRDGVTGEFIQGAALEFTAIDGVLTNDGLTFTSFQDNRPYVPDWATDSSGAFPNDVYLPTTNWNLRVMASGYSTSDLPAIIEDFELDEERDLGVLYLVPIDSDGDGMADSWEIANFGTTDTLAGGDEDGDGKENLDEYLDGTQPTNAASFFGMFEPDLDTMTMKWRAAPGRTYGVLGADDIIAQNWTNLSGVLEAGTGVTNLSWTDTTFSSVSGRTYQVKRLSP